MAELSFLLMLVAAPPPPPDPIMRIVEATRETNTSLRRELGELGRRLDRAWRFQGKTDGPK